HLQIPKNTQMTNLNNKSRVLGAVVLLVGIAVSVQVLHVSSAPVINEAQACSSASQPFTSTFNIPQGGVNFRAATFHNNIAGCTPTTAESGSGLSVTANQSRGTYTVSWDPNADVQCGRYQADVSWSDASGNTLAGQGFGVVLNWGVDCNAGGGTPPPPTCTAPAVTTASATNITQTSAQLNATINPRGRTVTYHFEYGVDQNSLTSTPNQTVSGSGAQSVSAVIDRLTPNTQYVFRVVASNPCGGADIRGQFLTLNTNGQCTVNLVITTLDAINVTTNSATLQGTVDPRRQSTTVHFEYGTDPNNLNQQTAAQTVGGDAIRLISTNITGLTQNTTYYFRIVGTNPCGGNDLLGQIHSFTTGGTSCTAPAVLTLAASNVTQNSAQLNATVNPNGQSTNVHFEYGTDQANLTSTATQTFSGTGAQNVTANISGLQANTTYYVRIVASNPCGGSNVLGQFITFYTNGGTCTAPTVITTGYNNLTQTSVTLMGTVNPNGNQTTSVYFQYGTDPNNLNQQTATQSFSGNGVQQVPALVTGLQNNTTYYFRLVATNPCGGSNILGAILSFTTGGGSCTPPTITTLTATGITQTSAVLNGSVNPNGQTTYAYFQYGTDPNNLSQQTASQTFTGTNTQQISTAIYSLQPNITYYFRLVATNPCGGAMLQGAINNFTTNTGGGGSGNLQVTKLVRNITLGQTIFQQNTQAQGLDVLEFQIMVMNNTGSQQSFTVQDILPNQLFYVPGSTTIDGSPLGDGITTGGVNIGIVNPGQQRDIRFRVTVYANVPQQVITNTANVNSTSGTYAYGSATATVTIQNRGQVLGVSDIVTGSDNTLGLSILIGFALALALFFAGKRVGWFDHSMLAFAGSAVEPVPGAKVAPVSPVIAIAPAAPITTQENDSRSEQDMAKIILAMRDKAKEKHKASHPDPDYLQ
ncbi:MAG: fibronectin type III domain-containing protein, partial [Candidatus Liptonbacteria bacterium]